MADKRWIADYLAQYYDEVEPMDFYRAIFPEGELEKTGERETGMYTAIACELEEVEGKNTRGKRYTITDDLHMIDALLDSDKFVLLSPISYAGLKRCAKNARFIYALAIDLDGIEREGNLIDLFHQIDIDYLPCPTCIVWSGQGLHLYFRFERPIPCYKHVTKELSKLKHELTRLIWNGFVTKYEDNVQYQSLFQGFRLVGGVTKAGGRTRAFEIGDAVTIDYLNGFVRPEYQAQINDYKSKLSLAEAKRKYPEWYKRRIEDKAPRGTWKCKRELYDWWKRRLTKEIVQGHRFHGMMVLAVYAKKCGIPYDELKADALSLVEVMDYKTKDKTNPFTVSDALAAIKAYDDKNITFSINAIEKYTDLRINRNKRNGRKQAVHLARIRALQQFDDETNSTDWRKGNGRKSKQAAVEEWRRLHPEGRKVDCIRETGLGKTTVNKWW